MYPNERVVRFLSDNFVTAKIHIKNQQPVFERFGVQWTPTLLTVDGDGKEQHRFEGFLPPDDFVAMLHMALAKAAFNRGDFARAEKFYRQVVERFADSDAAPEAQYWAGVSKYKRTGDPAALAETAQEFRSRYGDSSWAKKASVWGQAA